MNAREDPDNMKATHDYIDIFNILFKHFYNLFISNKIDLFLISCIPHVGSDLLAYKIAKELKIKTIIFYQSILPNRFFYISDIETFGDFNNYPILRQIEKYSITHNKNILPYMDKIKPYRITLLKYIGRIIKRRDLSPFWRYNRYKQYKNKINKLETSYIIFNCAYVYFPLHLDPELTTSALGGEYKDQLLAIERLTEIIPKKWKIYIKENPKQTEYQRGKWFFKRLEKLDNVILVSAKADTFKLIENSMFVATITGTVGWEAIIRGKIVVVFGLAWYRSLPGVIQYHNKLKIDDVINYTFSITDLEKAIGILLSKMGKGVVYSVYYSLVNNFNEDKNACEITKFIENLI